MMSIYAFRYTLVWAAFCEATGANPLLPVDAVLCHIVGRLAWAEGFIEGTAAAKADQASREVQQLLVCQSKSRILISALEKSTQTQWTNFLVETLCLD